MPEAFPSTLEQAVAVFPSAYDVSFKREGNDGGFYFLVKRAQHRGTFSIIGKTCPTWREAFDDVWGKL